MGNGNSASQLEHFMKSALLSFYMKK